MSVGACLLVNVIETGRKHLVPCPQTHFRWSGVCDLHRLFSIRSCFVSKHVTHSLFTMDTQLLKYLFSQRFAGGKLYLHSALNGSLY